MKRVNNPSKHLKAYLKEKDEYYIGFNIHQLTELGKNNQEIKDLRAGRKSLAVISGRKGALKENTKGKYIRKQPERKISVWRHIDYFNHYLGQQITYDRQFSVWEKELLHKYSLELSLSKSPHQELIFHFPKFKMKDDEKHYLKAGAAMNMAILLGGYYMIYDKNLNPVLRITKTSNKSILPAGHYNSVKEKLDAIERNLKKQEQTEESKANSYRFATLRDLEPDDTTIGVGGFSDYLMFEYVEKNLMILENLHTGNATYLFTLSNFDKTKSIDKQTAKDEPSFLKRIKHNNMQSWKIRLMMFFK